MNDVLLRKQQEEDSSRRSLIDDSERVFESEVQRSQPMEKRISDKATMWAKSNMSDHDANSVIEIVEGSKVYQSSQEKSAEGPDVQNDASRDSDLPNEFNESFENLRSGNQRDGGASENQAIRNSSKKPQAAEESQRLDRQDMNRQQVIKALLCYPEDQIKLVWDIFTSVALVTACFMTPLSLAFDSLEGGHRSDK